MITSQLILSLVMSICIQTADQGKLGICLYEQLNIIELAVVKAKSEVRSVK